MTESDDAPWGQATADRYDESPDPMFSPEVVEPAVARLAELAAGRPALELGIGTGRIALPLAERGIQVHGIDLSRPMVEHLRAKLGGAAIPVTIGDFSSTRVDGSFGLVYVVYNTIMNVTTQTGQVDVFRNAAAHLLPGGRFLIEVGVPSLRRLPPGETFVPFDVSDRHLGFDEYDVANQGLVSHHWTRRGETWEASSGPFRYVWPAELDLMAELAGLRFEDRWAGWLREPFTSESRSHVSVWLKP
jgi:SAM-dependent methyltransferase